MSSALEDEWYLRVNRMLAEVEEAVLKPKAKSINTLDLKSIPQAARLLGLHPKSLYRIVEQGKIPAYGSRGRLRVCIPDLLPRVEPRRHALKKLKNAAPGGMAQGAENLA